MPQPNPAPGVGRRCPLFRPVSRAVVVCLCFLTQLGVVLLLVLSIAVRPGEPGESEGSGGLLWVAFMGRTFAFQLTLASLLAGVVAAFLNRKRFLIPLALVMLATGLSWREVRTVWPRGENTPSAAVASPTPTPRDTLRVLSMNLLFVNHDTEKVLGQIAAANADVVLLQEYHEGWDTRLRPALREQYPFECRPLHQGSFGQALYSKRPFVGEPMLLRLHPKDYCPQIGVVVEVGGREIELWDIHLVSPSGIEEIRRQWSQLAVLRGDIEKRTRPMVLMGDFNSTPMSWNADLLRSLGLHEAHAGVGRGRGATWPVAPIVKYLPGIRIDQAWASDEIEWVSSRVGGETGSDHLPNIVELTLN